MKKTFLLTTLALFLMQLGYAQNKYIEYIYVSKIDSCIISYNLFEYRLIESKILNVPNLYIETLYYENINKQSFATEAEVKIHLLSNGYAKIKDTQKASQKEIDAENTAKEQKKGIWAKTKESEDKFNWSEFYQKHQGLILFFCSILLGSGLIWKFWSRLKQLYKSTFVERKINLLILGDKSAGKTSLIRRLSDDRITTKDILNISPTSTNKDYKRMIIPCGSLNFIPMLTDIPGAQWDTKAKMINNLKKSYRRKAIIYILSFTERNDTNIPDNEYIYKQLGHLESQFGHIMSLGKPVSFILFINKFDLISTHKPGDSNSTGKEKEIRELFKKHINVIETEGYRKGIKTEIIIGSCSKFWNTDNLIQKIAHNIINKK